MFDTTIQVDKLRRALKALEWARGISPAVDSALIENIRVRAEDIAAAAFLRHECRNCDRRLDAPRDIRTDPRPHCDACAEERRSLNEGES